MSVSKIDRSDVLALLAILISFTSLGLGIYEAKIMKQETEIMLSQQKTSVWPYIDKNTAISYSELAAVRFSITNKGVGPALINKILLEKDGQTISTDYVKILSLFNPIFDGLDQKEGDNLPLNISTGFRDNIVLSPGETVDLLNIKCGRFPNDTDILGDLVRGLKIKICYASIYGDNWLLEDNITGPQAIETCDIME